MMVAPIPIAPYKHLGLRKPGNSSQNSMLVVLSPTAPSKHRDLFTFSTNVSLLR
eukprot:c27113_g1_i1 orf=124-285(+)